jgi:hypothetical protein
MSSRRRPFLNVDANVSIMGVVVGTLVLSIESTANINGGHN